jgi:putative membrane protein
LTAGIQHDSILQRLKCNQDAAPASTRGGEYVETRSAKMMGYGIMGFGWLTFILMIGGLAWFVIHAAQIRTSDKSDRKGKAIEILNERFARGEIGQDEYQRKQEMLSH